MSVNAMTLLADATDLVQWVEPRIGTAHSVTKGAGLFGKGTEELGQTLPAVLEPNGMNFWTPQTRATERKCVAPYYYADSLFQGFRNSHWIVGGCTQDYGSVTVMPMTGALRTTAAARASRFDHDGEVARPDYYEVRLPDESLTAAVTATCRAAMFKLDFDNDGTAHIVVTPNSDENQGSAWIDLANRRIYASNPAHRIYQGKGQPAGFAGWFVLEWPEDLDVTDWGTFQGDDVFAGEDCVRNAPGLGAYISFKSNASKPVYLKAASSFTGAEGAALNMEAELASLDFDAVRNRLNGLWHDRLGMIKVVGGTETEMRKFYSALYRSSFLPRVFNDFDGAYPAFGGGGKIMYTEPGHDYYEDFSMWDTYRALHPLLNIIVPDKAADMMQSLVLKYEQGGWLPIFPCWNSYTAAMIGDHCASVLADAWVKGVHGFDIATAWEAVRRNAFESPADSAEYRNGMGRRALGPYLQYGYIPVEDSVPDAYHKREQVSRTLEYAYDDFAAATLARLLGHEDEADALDKRAANWRNVFNPATGYVAPRDSSGRFLDSDPFAFSKNITEGAPCHYTWYVPHDIPGLIDAMGGREAFVAKLDSMFSSHRYWHGNEPCHQVAWMYNWAGEPEKTVAHVREIMQTEYLDTPGGLSGNDDAGQMSAWYVFAAMGFYPVCPATDLYAVGAPAFKHVQVALPGGKSFTIDRLTDDDGVTLELDGKTVGKHFITHGDILRGAELKILPNHDKELD